MAPYPLLQQPTAPRDGGVPRTFVAARGAVVVDDAGTEWVDLDNMRGSVLLGHGDERVAAAVAAAAAGARGSGTGWSRDLDTTLGLLEAMLGSRVAALFRTGTAAVRAATEAVRAARGRPLVLSAGYHGYDPMWDAAGVPFEPNAAGVVDFCYDLDVLAEALADPAGVAVAVISPDHVHLTPEWYAAAAKLLAEAAVPVVLDEVKTGLRYRAGLSVAADVLPCDVWVVAKGVANGLPVAAVGGDPALLGALAHASFTSFFEPCALAAAAVSCAALATGEPQEAVAAAGGAFVAHAAAELRRAGLPVAVVGTGHLFQFVCADAAAERAFYAATARAGLLCFERDNQAPSAAFAAVAGEAAARFTRACADLDAAALGQPGEWSRYVAAWNMMDGLADLPRHGRAEAAALVARLREEA